VIFLLVGCGMALAGLAGQPVIAGGVGAARHRGHGGTASQVCLCASALLAVEVEGERHEHEGDGLTRPRASIAGPSPATLFFDML
jgi:hypothetical protein